MDNMDGIASMDGTVSNSNTMDEFNRRSLNLPPGMSRSTLSVNTRLEADAGTSNGAGNGTGTSSSTPSPSPSRNQYSDRFIPSRSGSNLAGFALLEKASPSGGSSDGREEASGAYSTLLRTELFGPEAAGPLSPATPEKMGMGMRRDSKNSPMSPNRNIFKFKSGSNSRPESPYSLSPVGSDADLCGVVCSPPKAPRKIARSPFKVLDAPALQDDFYLNLVDWSSHNVLAVGLGTCVYLWSACSSKVTKLCDLGLNDSVCSVGWTQRGTYLAVGTNIGEVQVIKSSGLSNSLEASVIKICPYNFKEKITLLVTLINVATKHRKWKALGFSLHDKTDKLKNFNSKIWDATRCKKVRTMEGHRTRVGALAWSSHILSSGSRDRNILQRDIRVQDDFVSKLGGHKSEVCGLKWSYDNRELASGGNDNQLLVWNQQSTQPVVRFSEHTAAVKAIAWSPHQHGLLASGGGTADRCIRFWNTATNSHLNCIDTGSQVCNLVWSKNVNELVSTHGYSQNQIIVWRYPTMSKLATLTGHTLRVLYLAISPDGQTIVTGAGDETLRFWNVFPSPKSQ
ncbi:hypothetical protein KI387_001629, partial [Taxus chinensis]